MGIAAKAWRKVRGRTAKHALRRAVANDSEDVQLLELHAQVSKFLFNGSVPPQWDDFASQRQKVRVRLQQRLSKQAQVREGEGRDAEEQGGLDTKLSLEASGWELVDVDGETVEELQCCEKVEKEDIGPCKSDGDEVEQDVLVLKDMNSSYRRLLLHGK